MLTSDDGKGTEQNRFQQISDLMSAYRIDFLNYENEEPFPSPQSNTVQ